MAPRARPPLLQPSGTVVRHLARRLVDEADGAVARLDANDPEALHDFRVAVRRLRTLLRAWEEMAQVPAKTARQLRKLARATNATRDLEVALENLRQTDGGDPAAALGERLARRHLQSRNETIDVVRGKWPGLSARLHRQLDAGPAGATLPFRQAASRILAAEWGRLQAVLDALRADWEDETAHRARLAGKRLRYLLEPFTAEMPAARDAVSALKRFQDRFGRYHDLRVLLALLAEEAAADAAAATHARICGNTSEYLPAERYVAFAEALRGQRNRLAEALRSEYLAPTSTTLASVSNAIAALAAG